MPIHLRKFASGNLEAWSDNHSLLNLSVDPLSLHHSGILWSSLWMAKNLRACGGDDADNDRKPIEGTNTYTYFGPSFLHRIRFP